MKAVDNGGNPPASPGSNAIEKNGVENPDPHDFANDGRRERLEICFFNGQKSEARSYFDASEQKDRPLRRTQALCYPSVLKPLLFIEDAGWPVYAIRSLSMREGGGTPKNNAE